MAVLKTFKSLTNNDWDVISNVVLNKRNNRIGLTIPHGFDYKKNPDFIIIARNYPEKIIRTYCRCGYTSGNGKHHECPKCGNKNRVDYEISGGHEYVLGFNYQIISGDPIIMKSTKFVAYADTKTSEFVFKENPANIDYEIYENYTVCSIKDAHINDYSLEELYNTYSYDKEDFKYYYNQSTLGFLQYIQYKGYFPILMNGISKYPNMVNLYCKDDITPITHPNLTLATSFEDIIKNVIKCPNDELIPHMDKLFDDSVYNYRASRWGSPSTISLSIFEDFDKLKTDEMKKAILYVVAHGNFKGSNIKSLINTIINTSGFDEEEELLFANYFMANYITEGSSAYTSYEEKKKRLASWGYKPIAANLEKRNFNIIKNLKELENRGYNPKKASFFMDAFELDPLGSLKYLESRRAPNKEMREELLKKVD